MKKQQGLSLISVLIIVLLLTFSGLFLFKIASLQWDDYLVAQILNDLSEDIKPESTVLEVESLLNRQLNINGLNLPLAELVIKKHRGRVAIDWRYERRRHVIWNVDIALTFNHEYSY